MKRIIYLDFIAIFRNNCKEAEVINLKNMTEGNPIKLIFFFALPLMFGNVLQQIYTIADTMIVGQFLGVDALASIGACDWINWAFLGMIMGYTQGFSIRISHAFGANDFKTMKKTLIHIFVLCICIALLITLFAHIIIEPLLLLLNTPNNIINGTLTYIRIIISGLIIVAFYNCFSSLLRALGNSKTPLIAMIFASITNIVLDYLFVVHFKAGIGGAAVATLIAQCLAASICGYILFKELPFEFHRNDFVIEINIIKDLMNIATPLAFQNLIISIGGIAIQNVANGFGYLFVAGFTATNKLYGILEVAAISFGYAITTFTSQNFGAKKYIRLKKGVFEGNILSLLASLIISSIMIVFGKDILMLFISGTNEEVTFVLNVAYRYLSYMAYFLPVLYILYTYRSALQGMENTIIPMISGIIELIIRVSLVYTLTIFISHEGVYIAEVMAWVGAATILYISYKIKIKNFA